MAALYAILKQAAWDVCDAEKHPEWHKGVNKSTNILGLPARKMLTTIATYAGDRIHTQTFGEKVLAIARKELGVKEHPAGSNDGPRIRQYQIAGGILHPETVPAIDKVWCSCFVTWCLLQAGLPKSQIPKGAADVTSYLNAAKSGVGFARTANPNPGDLVIYQWDSGDVDHIGIFEKWVVHDSSFTAVEGNTAIGNDSNGGEVMDRARFFKNVAAFVRVKV